MTDVGPSRTIMKKSRIGLELVPMREIDILSVAVLNTELVIALSTLTVLLSVEPPSTSEELDDPDDAIVVEEPLTRT